MRTPPLPTCSQMESANGKHQKEISGSAGKEAGVFLPLSFLRGPGRPAALPPQPQLLQVALLQGANSHGY